MAILTALLILLPTAITPSTVNIEMAFLQNSAKKLYPLVSSQSAINISLPEPISFSDQISNQQAYFLWKRIFSSYITFEFYSESLYPLPPENENYILKARWSFRNKKNNNPYVFRIFIYLTEESEKMNQESKLEAGKKNENSRSAWRIIEIKAEKI